MKIGVIGLGQAGGRIADLLTYHAKWGIHGPIVPFSLAVNSARADLMGLKTIPMRDRILIGQTEVKGHGVGSKRDVGARVTRAGLHTITHAVMGKLREHVDAFVIVVGSGGGTGSGGAPLVAQELKNIYTEPVYGIVILPSDEEGGLAISNALQCVQELGPVVNGILFFDNNLWKREGLTVERTYDQMNRWLVKPFPALLGAGETTKRSRVGFKVMDAADVINTWSGYAVLGYSEIKARTWLDRLLFFRRRNSIGQLNPTVRCYTVVRNALSMGLTARCKLEEAQRGLVLLCGPKKEITIEGYSQAREWLETVTGKDEIRGGDYPINELDELRGVVLLSGFQDLPRLQELRERLAAREAQP